jgi:hypothetical protein
VPVISGLQAATTKTTAKISKQFFIEDVLILYFNVKQYILQISLIINGDFLLRVITEEQ